MSQMEVKEQQYFDKTHPHYDKFYVKADTITLKQKGPQLNMFEFIHIMSPIPISQQFTSFSYKVIKSVGNVIMYGVGTKSLFNTQTKVYNSDNFVGYYGFAKGLIYDQKRKPSLQQKSGIGANDIIQIRTDLKLRTITWLKNGKKLNSTQLSQKLCQQKLYPTLIMCNPGDTVQMSYQNQNSFYQQITSIAKQKLNNFI